MAFCVNCGKALMEGANFCAFCGAKVGTVIPKSMSSSSEQSENKRETVYVGKLLKCPNCGEVITSSVTICPSCGYEITGKEANTTVKNFSEQLMQIESHRVTKEISVKSKIANAFFDPYANYRISEVDAQIISLIKNFPIPNSIEEITEFMYLAVANIDVNLSKNTFSNNAPGTKLVGGAAREISDAWVGKMQQIYAKAERVFPNGKEFEQMRDLYVSKMKELKMNVR